MDQRRRTLDRLIRVSKQILTWGALIYLCALFAYLFQPDRKSIWLVDTPEGQLVMSIATVSAWLYYTYRHVRKREWLWAALSLFVAGMMVYNRLH